MPNYTFGERILDIRRDCVILDTNVLVSAFLPSEQNYEEAYYYIYDVLGTNNNRRWSNLR